MSTWDATDQKAARAAYVRAVCDTEWTARDEHDERHAETQDGCVYCAEEAA